MRTVAAITTQGILSASGLLLGTLSLVAVSGATTGGEVAPFVGPLWAAAWMVTAGLVARGLATR